MTNTTLLRQRKPMIQDGRNKPNPYPLKERLARLAWVAAHAVLFRPVPRCLNGWRCVLLRLFGAHIGKENIIHPTVEVYFPWRLHTEACCVIGDRVKLYSLGDIYLGEHTVISQHAHLCAGTHDYTLPWMPLLRPGISIGKGCWICTDAFIGPGAQVGDGAVIGARSVVFGELPPGVVCAGNPCRPIKPRIMKIPP
ncbi:MAG: putative colanic acid biosynthesis acetyltransferase [Verrucomicrobiota bacterium]